MMVSFPGCTGKPEELRAEVTPTTLLPDSEDVTFDEVFALEHTTVIEGAAEEPLFRLGHFSVTKEHFIIPDPSNHRVLRFTRDGAFVNAWGRDGQGPGEFSQPDWTGVDHQGRIFVRENTPNFRVQIFDPSGQYLATFPLYTFGPLTQSYIAEQGKRVHFVTVTRVFCQEEERELCTVQEQNLRGEVLRRYAPEREIQPDFKGLPFIAGRDKDGRMYMAHRSGDRVAIYDVEGKMERIIDLKQSPDVLPLDMASLPDDPVKRVEITKKSQYTLIRNIYPLGDYVVIDFFRMNFPEKAPKVVINVFDRAGKLQYYGIENKTGFTQGAGDRLYIVNQDETVDFGRYEIRQYRLRLP
ncbi:6-bladed beta-propeller [Rhodocaloribacter sp.]